MGTGKCTFSGRDAKVVPLQGYLGYSILDEDIGEYWITDFAVQVYQQPSAMTKEHRMLCLQEVAKLSREGLIPFWDSDADKEGDKFPAKVVPRSIPEFRSRVIEHKDKDKLLLAKIGEKVSRTINPFQGTRLSWGDRVSLGIFEDEEFITWVVYLVTNGYLDLNPEARGLVKELGKPMMKESFMTVLTKSDALSVTVKGWKLLEAMNLPANTKNVFIAMAFTDGAGNALSASTRDTIKQTLEGLKWKPIIVDEVEHNDGVMDKVIASINDAKFVVSELTHQKSGVYYEAGYAKGRGLPVIHVVHKDDLEKCHFDVKHLNLIVWSSPEELSARLRQRIEATIQKA